MAMDYDGTFWQFAENTQSMTQKERCECLESIRPDGFTLDEVYNYIMIFPFELNPYFNSLEFMLMVTERIGDDA